MPHYFSDSIILFLNLILHWKLIVVNVLELWQNKTELVCLTAHWTHWCSIWKLRCPQNQSLKKDCSILQVAFSCDKNKERTRKQINHQFNNSHVEQIDLISCLHARFLSFLTQHLILCSSFRLHLEEFINFTEKSSFNTLLWWPDGTFICLKNSLNSSKG